jgi:hypothetical protein
MRERPSDSKLPLAIAFTALLVVGGALYVFRSVRQLPLDVADKGRELLKDARALAEAFRTGKVSYAFASEATELNGTTRLQVATLRQTEVFERKDEAAVFWGQLALPDVVVEARAPVDYVYFLDLQKPWSFRLEGRDVRVDAPALEFNTPAVDVSALRYEVRAGSVLRDEAEALERLKQGLTELSRVRARQNSALVRDTARRQAERFVETWLLHGYDDAKDYRVSVRFADEPGPAQSPSVPPLGHPEGRR